MFSNSDHYRLRKLGLKFVTWAQKIWQNWTSYNQACTAILSKLEAPKIEYHKSMLLKLSKCCYFYWLKFWALQRWQGVQIYWVQPGMLGSNMIIFVKFFKLKLKTLNLIYSASSGQNQKISVPIRKRISWIFQNSPYFLS